ncbi:unnamed protein product, partial [marine sediment metagenome]
RQKQRDIGLSQIFYPQKGGIFGKRKIKKNPVEDKDNG